MFEELSGLLGTLRENEYLEELVNMYMTSEVETDEIWTVNQKSLFIWLQFGSGASRKTLIQITLNAGNLWLTFSTHTMVTSRSKNEIPRIISSSISQFDCSCGASYVSQSSRNLGIHARQHVSEWEIKSVVKTVSSSILTHLAQTRYSVSICPSYQ